MTDTDTRSRLVSAAKELLWERGVAATSPNMVLDRARAGQGSLYHFFPGKPAWALEAITEVAAELRAEADDVFADGPGGLAAIERYLQRPRSALLGCRLGRLAFDPDVIADERLRAPITGYFEHLRRLLARAVREAVRQGELPHRTDARALAEALCAVVQGAYVTGRASDDSEAMRRATKGMQRLLRAASPAKGPVMTQLIDFDFGPSAQNRLTEAATPGYAGSVAALETFYYALNQADLEVLAAVWSADGLAQLNNPVGGILRSGERIVELYARIFSSGMGVQVTFTDAATYDLGPAVVFAGREIGSYRGADGRRVPLAIRTTRVFGWSADAGRWEQLHHHGSIDDPAALAAYQAAAGVR